MKNRLFETNIFKKRNLLYILERLGAADLEDRVLYGDTTIKYDLIVENQIFGKFFITKSKQELFLLESDTTPDVSQGNIYETNNVSFLEITNFTGGIPGQPITIIFGDENTVLKHNGNIKLQGGVNFYSTIYDSIEFLQNREYKWIETNRSLNS